jgi:hypothetical protein
MLMLLLSAALLGAESAPPPKPKTEIRLPAAAVAGVVPQGRNDEIVCRKEQLLGSRMFKTVCEQKSIAEERRQIDQQAVRQIQEQARGPGQ